MKNEVTIQIGDRVFPLEARMSRMRLLYELTGIDILNQARKAKQDKAGESDGATVSLTEQLLKPGNISAAMYALAGGERRTSMSLEDFEDELDYHEVGAYMRKFQAVLTRDTPDKSEDGGDSGNATSGE
jgi:hypothetical protein